MVEFDKKKQAKEYLIKTHINACYKETGYVYAVEGYVDRNDNLQMNTEPFIVRTAKCGEVIDHYRNNILESSTMAQGGELVICSADEDGSPALTEDGLWSEEIIDKKELDTFYSPISNEIYVYKDDVKRFIRLEQDISIDSVKGYKGDFINMTDNNGDIIVPAFMFERKYILTLEGKANLLIQDLYHSFAEEHINGYNLTVPDVQQLYLTYRSERTDIDFSQYLMNVGINLPSFYDFSTHELADKQWLSQHLISSDAEFLLSQGKLPYISKETAEQIKWKDERYLSDKEDFERD